MNNFPTLNCEVVPAQPVCDEALYSDNSPRFCLVAVGTVCLCCEKASIFPMDFTEKALQSSVFRDGFKKERCC